MKPLYKIILGLGLIIFTMFLFKSNDIFTGFLSGYSASPVRTNIKNVKVPIKQVIAPVLVFPIDNALKRVTKKAFGLKVSPKNSPVSPEKFTGYHTGTDFETFDSEKNTEVDIYAVCTGPLILKKMATGYGGVVVQQCELEKQPVTIIYGHLKFTSITISTKVIMKAGEKIGILGKGYSSETDGERKHLHLGIHKGKTINILGYVSLSKYLSDWIDPMKYLK